MKQNMIQQMLASSMGLRADFDVDANRLDAHGNIISTRRALTACPNLITNYGMDHLGTNSIHATFGALHIGSNATAPVNGNTSLGTKIAAVAAGGVGDNVWTWDTTNPKTLVLTRVFTFTVGSAAGTLRELGMSPATNGSICTHALFKDPFGDPTSVEVASDEQLVVTYRLYLVPSEVDAVLVKVQNGTECTLTYRPGWLGVGSVFVTQTGPMSVLSYGNGGPVPNCYGYSGPSSGVGPLTGGPTGTQSTITQALSCTVGTYTNGNYYRDDTLTVPLAALNLNELGAFSSNNAGYPFRFQLSISPRVNKTSNDTLKFTVRTRWYRL